jgi:flavin-dependent dehydrogenase
MAVARHGYVGLVRVENNRLNVATAFDANFLRESGSPASAAIRILNDAGLPELGTLRDATWRGTPPLTRTARPTALHRLLLVGDAAGYVEPFTGEGMAWALESGRNAASTVHNALENWSEETCAQWHADYSRRFAAAQRRCRIVAAGLRNPIVTSVAIRALHTTPALARPFVNAINSRPPHREYAP